MKRSLGLAVLTLAVMVPVISGPASGVLRAHDGARDTVNCGDGNADRATVDPGDTVVWCERIAVIL